MRDRLGPYGIRCNSVMPGTIATDLNKEDLSSSEKLAYMQARIPLGRLGTPEDVAKVVVFLASDMARTSLVPRSSSTAACS